MPRSWPRCPAVGCPLIVSDTFGGSAMRALPDFPWDRLAPYLQTARAHRDGLVDLSIGTPVDPTPELIQAALRAAADAPGYPTVWGTAALRDAIAGWLGRRLGVAAVAAAILPTIGSKELVAWLPLQLGLGSRDVVAIPALAYPTYDVGARIAGCQTVVADGVEELEAARLRIEATGRRLALAWLNSPSNPTGAVIPAAELRAIVEWGRTHDVCIVSDECYIELAWDTTPVSLLHPSVCGDDHHGLLAVHSLSKRSNLAGYRGAFVTGDAERIKQLLAIRKHAGMMVPMPVQAAMIAAYNDDAHVAEQHAVYARRREVLRSALLGAGFEIAASEAGLYLWATRGESCWDTLGWLAERGIVAAPGEFYGAAGARHVRVALTGSDAGIDSVADRLA